jgi:hypothetical protein
VVHGSSDEGFSMDDFHTLRERVSVMRTDYQQLLTDMTTYWGMARCIRGSEVLK